MGGFKFKSQWGQNLPIRKKEKKEKKGRNTAVSTFSHLNVSFVGFKQFIHSNMHCLEKWLCTFINVGATCVSQVCSLSTQFEPHYTWSIVGCFVY